MRFVIEKLGTIGLLGFSFLRFFLFQFLFLGFVGLFGGG